MDIFKFKNLCALFLVLTASSTVISFIRYHVGTDIVFTGQNLVDPATLAILKRYMKLVEEDYERDERDFSLLPLGSRKNDEGSLRVGLQQRNTDLMVNGKYDQQKRGIQALAKNRDFPRRTSIRPSQKELVVNYSYPFPPV